MSDATGEQLPPDLQGFEFESSGRRLPVRLRTVGFSLVTAVVVGAWYYEWQYVTTGLVPPWGWAPGISGYLMYVSLAFVVFYLGVPLIRRRRLSRRYWRRLRRRPAAMVSGAYLLLFALAGTFGPGFADKYNLGANPDSPYPPRDQQPPFGATFDASGQSRYRCVGEMTDSVCHGTWNFPLGTTVLGNDMIDVLLGGTQVALEIAVITGAVIVPIAVAVGTVAAYYGGWVDEVLMRIVEVVQVIPALLIVILLQQLFNRNVMVIVIVFGLLEWGSTARMVRSEALQRVGSGYVKSAKSAGLGNVAIIRRHVVPNVSSTVVTSVTQLMPKLILVEAAIAFMGWSAPFSQSWGATLRTAVYIQHKGMMVNWPGAWWNYVFPGLLLALTTAALHVFGDAMREVLDPRIESE